MARPTRTTGPQKTQKSQKSHSFPKAQGTHPAQKSHKEPQESRESPPAQENRTPVALRVAAAAQAVEAAGMCVAAGFSAASTAAGQSYQQASGIALTVIALGTAAVLALFALGLARARPWSRTPVVMTQVFAGGAGIYLLDGHRPEWGVPALLLAATCLIALFTPAALRALNRPPRSPAP